MSHSETSFHTQFVSELLKQNPDIAQSFDPHLWYAEEEVDADIPVEGTLITMRHFPTFNNLVGLMQARDNREVWTDILPDQVERAIETRGLTAIPHPDRIVVSPLRRTKQTVQALARYQGWNIDSINVVEDHRLTERNEELLTGHPSYGQNHVLAEHYRDDIEAYVRRQGLSLSVDEFLYQRDPFLKPHADIHALLNDPDFKVGETGESKRDVFNRALPAFLEFAQMKGITLVCTHAGVMEALDMNAKRFDLTTVHKNEQQKLCMVKRKI